MAKLTHVTKGGPGGKYGYTYLPAEGAKVVWDGEEKPVYRIRDSPACQVPLSFKGKLLWVAETPLTAKRLEGWQPKHDVKINGNSYIVLPLPPECRKTTFEGEELVWAPGEILHKLQEAFGSDGIFVQQTAMGTRERYTVKVRGFMLFDEDYHAYDVSCPFCGKQSKFECFNELMWRGRCGGCGAGVGFEIDDSLDDAIADALDVLAIPKPESRGDWQVYEGKVAVRKVDEAFYITFWKYARY